MKRLMISPRTSSPEQPLGHVVCKPSIYKTALKSVPRRACAAGPERRTRKRVAGADQGGTGSSAINEGVDQEEMKGRLAKRPSHPSHLND
jgi:hypothetical protein